MQAALHKLCRFTARYVRLAAFSVVTAVGTTSAATASESLPAVQSDAATIPMRLDRAEFRAAGLANPLVVTLPDTWVQRGHPAGGLGHYHLRFSLPAKVDTVWALHADRLSTAHEIRLNGHLLHGSLQNTPQARRPIQTLVPIPPSFLQAGENTLDIGVVSGINAGMSALMLGPALDLAIEFQRGQQRAVGLPQLLNVAGAGVSLFMLLLWSRRRGDSTLGSFGALGLLASLRNVAYFEAGTVLPAAWAGFLYMHAQLITALLLGEFAMRFSGVRPRWFRQTLVTVALLFPAISLWALLADELQLARVGLYPLLLMLILPALGLVARAAWQRRTVTDAALVASLAGVLVGGIHDYLYQLGRLSVMDHFWTPYTVPVVVAVYSTLLLKRLLLALHEAERMNMTLERRVLERTRELQAANMAKTRFLAAASHDLRQPMVSIGLLVGLVEEQVGSGPLRRVVQRLQEATASMDVLLTRLLDLSRLQAGTVRVQVQSLSLQSVFDSVVSQHSAQAQSKGLRLRARPTSAVVDSDPVLLAQILGNLVANAVRYTQRGGVLLAARSAGETHWRVAVWDTGPGIPADQHEAIFGEFVRGDGQAASAESAMGMGLGLTIVQRSAELLNTAVALRSVVGRGSCFSVALPRSGGSAPTVLEAPDRSVHATPLSGRRVWLLEDDANARASMHLRLQHWGAEVQAFASLAALRLVISQPTEADAGTAPDLLVTDLRLPDGQGTDAVLQLRALWAGLPVLIVTGNTAPDELVRLEQWRETGVQVLLKPFASATLLAAAEAALASKDKI
jgi:signal transduction histidine kinase/ActR/RegA family two-component response regulator